MARSHPPTLLTLARRTLLAECHLGPAEKILVGVSGGGDSTALLHVLSTLSAKMGFDLAAHGVDHGLRKDAGSELDLAEGLADRLGVPFTRARLAVRPGGNLQARARSARKESLEAARMEARAARIATAHHADDRAETVLLRLLHGARPEALAVLAPSDGLWIRPLIRARKADVLAHLGRHGVLYAEDPSNRDSRFERTRVRFEVMPLLEQLSPAIVSHLTALADDLGWALGPSRTGRAGQGQGQGQERQLPVRRAHLDALRHALSLGRGARIRLSGGGDLVVEKAPSPQKPARGRRGGANGAKSG